MCSLKFRRHSDNSWKHFIEEVGTQYSSEIYPTTHRNICGLLAFWIIRQKITNKIRILLYIILKVNVYAVIS